MAKNGNSGGFNRSGLKNNKLIYLGIAIIAALIFFGSLLFFKNIYQQETYYVLNVDVATRTQVDPNMLTPVTTSAGTSPCSVTTPNPCVSLADVQSGLVYTKFPLLAGDILTSSNVGALDDISVGIPDNWVVTNFSVNADDAVGGRIKRGYYFDLMVIDTASGKSFYPFINVLCLDTTVSLDSASSNNAADTKEGHTGQTTQYVVGLSPKDAARLQFVVSKYTGKIKLVLSPRQNEYQSPNSSDYAVSPDWFNFDIPTAPGQVNGKEQTNNNFTDVPRDKFGKPEKSFSNCNAGNNRANECASNSNQQTQEPTNSTSPTPSVSSSPTSTATK